MVVGDAFFLLQWQFHLFYPGGDQFDKSGNLE
jgi:hypothetical protein